MPRVQRAMRACCLGVAGSLILSSTVFTRAFQTNVVGGRDIVVPRSMAFSSGATIPIRPTRSGPLLASLSVENGTDDAVGEAHSSLAEPATAVPAAAVQGRGGAPVGIADEVSFNELVAELRGHSNADFSVSVASDLLEERRGGSERTMLSKAFNATLLAVAFGLVLYTVLGIDSGLTRGWTQAEIAMRIPLDNWASYENALYEKPIATKTSINVIIYLLGDWLSQTLFQGKNVLDFDAARTLRNGFIGLCFGPIVHEYYEFSDKILPVDIGVNRLYKILMDQTIYLGIKCSVYIMAVGVLGGGSFEDSVQKVKERIGGIMVTAWKFWPLVHCVTYGLIPARHRILWVNSVDLIWNAILASKTSSESEGDDDDGNIKNENEGEEDRGRGLSLSSFLSVKLGDDAHGDGERIKPEDLEDGLHLSAPDRLVLDVHNSKKLERYNEMDAVATEGFLESMTTATLKEHAPEEGCLDLSTDDASATPAENVHLK